MLFITGDMHGEEERFTSKDSPIEKTLTSNDKLIICGDFGFISDDSYKERQFLRYLSEKPYQILFVDGNHENFTLIDEYQIEEWCGGKVHVIRRDKNGNPKIVHLIRGEVFLIEGRRIFTMGGAYSIDKHIRIPYKNWWPQEMPTEEEMEKAVSNLKKNGFAVDYIVTHAAPEETMNIFHPEHHEEKKLNMFLEWIRKNINYKHWYMGHLHRDEDLWRHQSILWFQIRNVYTNEPIC